MHPYIGAQDQAPVQGRVSNSLVSGFADTASEGWECRISVLKVIKWLIRWSGQFDVDSHGVLAAMMHLPKILKDKRASERSSSELLLKSGTLIPPMKFVLAALSLTLSFYNLSSSSF